MTTRELKAGDIVSRIFYIRGKKVMLDSDLASVYGVETKVLNQAVKRNLKRFPGDFFFQLTNDEWYSLRSQIVTLDVLHHEPGPPFRKGKHRKFLPYAFTEYGALMLATILNSEKAIYASMFVVRAFIQFREFLEVNKELAKKIEALETRYDEQFNILFEAIRELIRKKNEHVNPVGFRIPGKNNRTA
jgi:ORF6N domain